MGGTLRKYWNEETQEAAAEGSSLTSPPLNEESTSHATRSSTAGYSTPPHHLTTSSETQSESESNRRIVILGKTGAGKSSVSNIIFGEKLFKTSHSLNSETRKCQAETKSVNGRDITLIDTPGFYDTDGDDDKLKPEIVRCITECAPGPHAFLIVLAWGRFTEQEQAVIDKICQYFSEEAFKYTTVLFTHGDQLPEGETVEKLVHQNKSVSALVKKCGGRCHVIDNKYWNEKPMNQYRSNKFQVEELLKSVEKTFKANKGGCYTNEMLQAVEDKIQQQQAHIRKSPGNMSDEEIRNQAKGNVFTKLLTQVVDCAKDAVISALTGARNAVVVMMRLMKGYDAAEGADTT